MGNLGLQGKWPSHVFSTMKANGQFVPFDLGYFLDLTVFTLLSHKGKKSVFISPVSTWQDAMAMCLSNTAPIMAECVVCSLGSWDMYSETGLSQG